MVVSAFNLSFLESVDLYESEVTVLYKVRFRPVNSEILSEQQKLIYKSTGFVMIPFSFLCNRQFHTVDQFGIHWVAQTSLEVWQSSWFFQSAAGITGMLHQA